MKEIIVKGRKYRTLADSVNKIWHRISFWTAASDVQFEDGSYLEGKSFGHAILARNKSYKVGDIAYCHNAPSWVRLRCTIAGTTATQESGAYKSISSAGTAITDGTAIFVADDVRLASSVSTSENQAPTVGLLKKVNDTANSAVTKAGTVNLYVGSDKKLHFKNAAGADTALNFNPHGETYTFPVGHTGSTEDFGEVHKYQFFNAQNVYNKGVSDADARANPSSANYKTGYNKGVSDADDRVNTSSASYKNAYNKGVGDADARRNPDSMNYKEGFQRGYADGRNKVSSEYIESFESTYHHHKVREADNDDSNPTRNPYPNEYESPEQAGCFTMPKYHIKYSYYCDHPSHAIHITLDDGEYYKMASAACTICGESASDSWTSDEEDRTSIDSLERHARKRLANKPKLLSDDYWTQDPNDRPESRVETRYTCSCNKSNGQLVRQRIRFRQ